MIDGLSERIVKGNIGVLRLHYSADPDKRPGTEKGDQWLESQLSGYPGGLKSPRWRKEMEIEYGAMGGSKLIPDWQEWKQHIVVKSFDATGLKLYGSYDHGWRSPSAYLVHAIGFDGHKATIWEFYDDHVPVAFIKQIINGKSVRLPDGRFFYGNPYAGKEVIKIADPQIWAEDQIMSDNTMKSIAALFAAKEEDGSPGVHFVPGNHGGDTTVAEWLLGYYWADFRQPRYVITADCPKLIWELERLRHKEFSAKVALNREQPETVVDKDNHAWDSLKMFFLKFPPKPYKSEPARKPGTFNWWKEQINLERQGKELATYRRDMVG